MDARVSQSGLRLLPPVAVLFAFIFMACASQPVYKPQFLENADSAVNRARVEKAQDYSPKDFKLAEAKLSEAKDMHILEERTASLYLAQQAAIDARVATAKAESMHLFGEIRTLNNEIDQLRDEIDQYH